MPLALTQDFETGIVINHCYFPGMVALTFDDGPSVFTPQVLDLLEQYKANATFFVNGDSFARGNIDDPATPWPGLLRRMHSSGHQIGSHTWSHADLTYLDTEERHWQMTRLEAALVAVLGFFPTYLRPPFGYCNSLCEADMGDLGYHVVNFDVDTKDYENDSPTAIRTSMDKFAWGLSGDPATDSYIVLSHDTHEQTATTLLTFMLDMISQQGYKAVTVGECLGDPVENWYRHV